MNYRVRLAFFSAAMLLAVGAIGLMHVLNQAAKGDRFTAADGFAERAERIAADARLGERIDGVGVRVDGLEARHVLRDDPLTEAMRRLPAGVPCDATYTCDGRPRCDVLARYLGRPVGEDERDRAWLMLEAEE